VFDVTVIPELLGADENQDGGSNIFQTQRNFMFFSLSHSLHQTMFNVFRNKHCERISFSLNSISLAGLLVYVAETVFLQILLLPRRSAALARLEDFRFTSLALGG